VPPSRRPTSEVTLIAHQRGVYIIPDAPGGFQGLFGAGNQSDWLEYIQNIFFAAEPRFPVGSGYYAVDWTGAIIPELVSGTTVAETIGVSGEIDRRDTTQVQEKLPVTYQAISWDDYYAKLAIIDSRIAAGIPASELAEILPPGGIDQVDNIVASTNEDEDMGWYSDLDEKFFGGMLPGGAAPGSGGFPSFPNYGFDPLFNGGGNGGNGNGNGGYPPPPNFGGTGSCVAEDPMKGCVLKKVCGEWRWVKQKRRRRKSLMTNSDIKGLAVLKGLVGVGKTMDTWIATHS